MHYVSDPAETQVYSNDSSAYVSLPKHESVNHSVGEYVNGPAHTHRIASFWSMLKRGYVGVYDRMSPEHQRRYIREFEGRHNNRYLDTIDQMGAVVQGAEGKRLKYAALIRHPHGGEALDWTYVSVDPFYLLGYVDV